VNTFFSQLSSAEGSVRALIDAIIAGCGPKASKKFVVTRPPTGVGGGGFGGDAWWSVGLEDFLNWLYSIPVGVKPDQNL
jgi:hypothetical protein